MLKQYLYSGGSTAILITLTTLYVIHKTLRLCLQWHFLHLALGTPWTSMNKCQLRYIKLYDIELISACFLWHKLEVNKCAFTFSSEIRQIQCTRTEFWCVQCPRPAGPSALDKHQIQSSALDLSYFTSKSKCKFINLIHTRQKNKIICSCLWKFINKMALKCHKTRRILTNFTQWKKWISRCDVRARDHSPKAPRAVWVSLGAVRGVQWTFSIHSAYLLKSQSENKKFS